MSAPQQSDSAILVEAWLRDEAGFEEVFDRYRKRLRQMVKLRLDRRLYGRIDVDDVLQEAFLEAFRKLPDYRARCSEFPVFLWLRLVVGEKLTDLHRHHLGRQIRAADREVSIYRGPMPAASSVALAAQLMGSVTSPSLAALRAESRLQIQEALNMMDSLDREVLTLRHFEQLTNSQVAQVLEITQQAASNRYVRALKRMKEMLTAVRGNDD